MTFVDVSRTNLDVVRRLWSLKGLGDARFLHLERFADLDTLDTDYDAVFAFGSMHHIPAATGKAEFDALSRRLKPGGRFVMHAYPFSRWIADGRMPFETWGGLTDGPGTPWAEWYDAPKLIAQLLPARFALVFYCEFRDGAMNAIDLVKLDGHPTLDPSALPAGAREVRDGLRLAEVRTAAHWQSAIEAGKDGAVRITTSAAPWSYAAEIPLHLDDVPASARCFVRVDLTVAAGSLGVCLLRADGSSVVAEEQVGPLDAEQTCLVWFERGGDHDGGAATLMLRNAALSVPTHALVRSVRLYCL
jgi:SAM-dependent methyltransferase